MKLRFAWMMLLVIGCGNDVQNQDDLQSDQEDTAIKADGVQKPLSTFRMAESDLKNAADGDLVLLVLKTNNLFYSEDNQWCLELPCPPSTQTGTYQFTKSGRTTYLRLFDNGGALLRRFAYTFDGQTLNLRNTKDQTNRWVTLHQSAAWCAKAYDCKVQPQLGLLCIGAYACENNTCNFVCDAEYSMDCSDPEQVHGCANDEDCLCGTNSKTGVCDYGAAACIKTASACPDFCSGLAGNLIWVCHNGLCQQQ
jgi:hypothetical protein